VYITIHFFIIILLAAFPVTLDIQMMFTAGYFQEKDSGTRVEVGDTWVETNSDLGSSYRLISTAFRVTVMP
jgi:hypothetical protein